MSCHVNINIHRCFAREHCCTPRPFSLPLRHLFASSGLALHRHQVPPRGAPQSLNLAVCPSAACSPNSCAKVPHAIGNWLPVLRQATAIMCRAISPHAITKLAARPSALSAGKPRCHGQPASGKISGNQIKGAAMHRPSINKRSQVLAASTPSPTLPSLTGRSSGHQYLPASIGTLRASHSGAAYLGR